MGEVWNTFFGQAFDGLVYASIHRLMELLELPVSDLIQYGPFFTQRARKTKERGVQIDLMLIRKDNVITVVENKFTKDPVGAYIQDEVQAKVDRLAFPKNYTIEKVLISASGVTKAVSESGYFNKVITLEDIFGDHEHSI